MLIGLAIAVLFTLSVFADVILHKRRQRRARLRVIQGGKR